MITGLRALGRALRRLPVQPTSVAALLERHEAYLAFRRIVQEVFPDAADEILTVKETGANRESARVGAFLERVEREHFPCYQVEDYDALSFGVPFARDGWSYDRIHDTDLRPGDLLIFALCEQPFAGDDDTRIALLDACEAHVPRSQLLEIPDGGIPPAELHQRLDATPFAAAAEFADWLWGDIRWDCKSLSGRLLEARMPSAPRYAN